MFINFAQNPIKAKNIVPTWDNLIQTLQLRSYDIKPIF